MSTTDTQTGLRLDKQFAREVQGMFVHWQPEPAPAPHWLQFNDALALELGLDAQALRGDAGLAVFSGQRIPEGAEPVAQAYAGHQFGYYSPRLGDGRALLLGEIVDPSGQRFDLALKGSGATPFARNGDGKAAVGPVLREFLIGEAMHALGVPTTRVLAAVATGEAVFRESALPGAVLARVAASHLRVGSFEYAARAEDDTLLSRLAEHAIARHAPHLLGQPQRYLGLLEQVVERQATLIAQWMGLGFIHGVMNTDNMAISGQTIDYGPCAFMEHFDPEEVFSSIDRDGRYAWANQPAIAHWNLSRLAETLLPLIDADADRAAAMAMAAIGKFEKQLSAHWSALLRSKVGLPDGGDAAEHLATEFMQLLQRHAVDFTLGWRRLGDAAAGDEAPLRALFGAHAASLEDWLARWRAAFGTVPGTERAQAMAKVNPMVIPRNHLVEQALAAATEDDLAPFERLLAEVRRPFEPRNDADPYIQPAPREETERYRTFCGT
ncbi:MAG: protein adenylyltransferase SelO [Pseudomonadota bacterium]